MKDKYRRLLSSYKLRMEQGRIPATRELAPEQIEVLKRFVHRLHTESDPANRRQWERRESPRHPGPHVVLVTPCSTPDKPRMNETISVVLKDMSSGGICFVHTGAFIDPYFLTTIRVQAIAPICLLAKVQRVEPARLGLYLVGGKFLERVSLGDEYDRHGQSGKGDSGSQKSVE